MAEETKDQVPEEKKEEKKVETPEQSKEPKKPELPEKDFFRKDTMDKFVHETELFEKEQSGEKKPEEKAVEKEPTKPEEEKKAFKFIEREGKKVPVYSEEEYNTLASQGLDYTKKRQKDVDDAKKRTEDLDKREAGVREFESNIRGFQDKYGQPLETLLQAAKEGKLGDLKGGEKVDEDAEMKVKVKAFLDNQYVDEDQKAVVKFLLDKTDRLEAKTTETETKTQESEKAAILTREKVALNEVIEKTREEHPFEDLKDDDGNDLTETFLGGMVVTEVNKDRLRAMSDESFKPRDIRTVFRDSVIGMNKIEDLYRKRFSNSSGETEPEKLTVEQLSVKYPDQIKQLVQDGIVSFKKGEDETTVPIAKGRDVEAKVEKESKPEIKSVKHGVALALEDPEIEEGLAELAKSASLQK